MAAVLLIVAAAGAAFIAGIASGLARAFAAQDMHDFDWIDDEPTRVRAEIDAIVDSATDEQLARLWADLNDPDLTEAIERLDIND